MLANEPDLAAVLANPAKRPRSPGGASAPAPRRWRACQHEAPALGRAAALRRLVADGADEATIRRAADQMVAEAAI